MRMRLNVKLISGFILHKKELTAILAKDEQLEQKKRQALFRLVHIKNL